MNIYIVLFIILIGLTVGMYLSSAFNMNEQLSIKKNYLRGTTLTKIPKKTKRNMAYIFTIAMSFLFVGLSLNAFTENIPFQQIKSEQHLQSIFIDTEESYFDNATLTNAMDMLNQVGMKSTRRSTTLETKRDLYILSESLLTRIDKSKISGPLQQEAVLAQYEFSEMTGFSYVLEEMFQSEKHIIVIANVTNQTRTSGLTSRSLVFVHDKITLNLLGSFHINEYVKNMTIVGERLIILTHKERNNIEDPISQVPAIAFSNDSNKWQTTKMSNIVFLPNTGFSYILGVYSVNLQDFTATTKAFLLNQYIADFHQNEILLAFNTDIYKDHKTKNQYQSFILTIGTTSLKAIESSPMIGEVYDKFLFSDQQDIILSTLYQIDVDNQYHIYTFDRNLNEINVEKVVLGADEILKNTVDFAYIISKSQDTIFIRSTDSSWLYDITPATYDIKDISYFSRLLKDTVLVLQKTSKNITIQQLSHENIVLDTFQIQLNEFDEIVTFVFEEYFDGQNVLNFLKVVIQRNGLTQTYDYYMIPFINNKIDHNNKIIIPSSVDITSLDYSFTQDMMIVFSINRIDLYNKKTMQLIFSIISG